MFQTKAILILDKGNPSKPKQIQNAFFDDDFIN